MSQAQVKIFTQEATGNFAIYLKEQEKSAATIKQYTHYVDEAAEVFQGEELTKSALVDWKDKLREKYAVTSVNTIIAAVNSFLKFMGWNGLTIKSLKMQKETFCDEDQELTMDEYKRLIKTAETAGNRRLSLVIQTIGSTGIRISELQFITVEAVRAGRAKVFNKKKFRTVFLPDQLCRALTAYIKEHKLTSGSVFVTRKGNPLNRSNIWRDMKALCKSTDVNPKKVFPHNLRHLFARTHYSTEKDISRLADILGHTSINTTRIYTKESGAVHAAQIAGLGLFIT